MIVQGLNSILMLYVQDQPACSASACVLVDKFGMKLDLFYVLCSAFRKQVAACVFLEGVFCSFSGNF